MWYRSICSVINNLIWAFPIHRKSSKSSRNWIFHNEKRSSHDRKLLQKMAAEEGRLSGGVPPLFKFHPRQRSPPNQSRGSNAIFPIDIFCLAKCWNSTKCLHLFLHTQFCPNSDSPTYHRLHSFNPILFIPVFNKGYFYVIPAVKLYGQITAVVYNWILQ